METKDNWREEMAEKVHKVYCEQYQKDKGEVYWTGGDYSLLDEKTKNYDRAIVVFLEEEIKLALQKRDEKLREKMKELKQSYLIQNVEESDSEIIKASFDSRNWTFQAVLALL